MFIPDLKSVKKDSYEKFPVEDSIWSFETPGIYIITLYDGESTIRQKVEVDGDGFYRVLNTSVSSSRTENEENK